MNDIENAILNLNNENPVIRAQAIEICSKFQMLDFFDWNIWMNLSNTTKLAKIRIFAYTTLSIIMKNGWEQLSANKEFLSNFPFYNISNIINDPIKNAIVHCDSIFLLYLAPYESIIDLFDQVNNNNIYFISLLLSEFVACAYTQTIIPTQRKEIVDQFMMNLLPKYVQTIILCPLSQLKMESAEFSFFLSLLGKIHQYFIHPTNLLFSPDIENFYASFSPILWLESSEVSIVWIIDSLFSQGNFTDQISIENEKSFHPTLEPIAASLATSAPAIFLQSYGELFFQEPTEKYPKLLLSFIPRVSLFFDVLFRLNFEILHPLFEMLIVMLQSSSPTVIYDVSKRIAQLVKTLGKHPEFVKDASFYKYRMLMFETCIKLLSTPLELLPGSKYDDGWDGGNVRSSIFNLAVSISEIDTEMVVKELIRFIVDQPNDSPLLVSLIRLLSSSLSSAISPMQYAALQQKTEEEATQQNQESQNEGEKEQKDKKEEESAEETSIEFSETSQNVIEISEEAKNITSFLLSIVSDVSRSTENHIFTALTRLIFFLNFSEDELPQFFSKLLKLFILMKPSSYDSFTAYFTSFYSHFSKSGQISLPVEQLNMIPPDDPIYLTVATIISKFTGCSTMIDSALDDIEWFITSFNPQEQESIDHLNRKTLQSFDFIAQNPPKTDDMNFVCMLMSKIVAANNVLVDIANSIQDEAILKKLISPFSHLSNAVNSLTDSFPKVMLSLIQNIHPIIFVSECAALWLKKIILPVLSKLGSSTLYADQTEFSQALENISEFAKSISLNLIQAIDMVCSNPDSPASIENSAKKVGVILVKFCRFILNDENMVARICAVCLRLEDFRCFSNVVEVTSEKGIHLFALFWNDFVQRNDSASRDKICEGLFLLYDKANRDLNQFLQLPGVTSEQIAAVEIRLQNCGSAKTIRKHIRSLIPL